jgi:hypothetical protein
MLAELEPCAGQTKESNCENHSNLLAIQSPPRIVLCGFELSPAGPQPSWW